MPRGRPKSNRVDYFPHQVRHGKSIRIVEAKYGNDGYAIVFKVFETLGDSDGHVIDLTNDETILDLAAYCRVDESQLREVLELMSRIGVIDDRMLSEGLVWSQNFVDGLEPVYKKRGREVPVAPISGAVNSISVPENAQSRVEKREERKEPAGAGSVFMRIGNDSISAGYWKRLTSKLGSWDAMRACYYARNAQTPRGYIEKAIKGGYALTPPQGDEEVNGLTIEDWFNQARCQ